MADDQESVDAKFREFLQSRDGQEVVARMAAAALGYELGDKPRKDTYLYRVSELRTRFEAGELTEEQFRDGVRALRDDRDAQPES
jgi:hypothetical protein